MVQRVVFTDTDKESIESILETLGFIPYDANKDKYDLCDKEGEVHLQINLNARNRDEPDVNCLWFLADMSHETRIVYMDMHYHKEYTMESHHFCNEGRNYFRLLLKHISNYKVETPTGVEIKNLKFPSDVKNEQR